MQCGKAVRKLAFSCTLDGSINGCDLLEGQLVVSLRIKTYFPMTKQFDFKDCLCQWPSVKEHQKCTGRWTSWSHYSFEWGRIRTTGNCGMLSQAGGISNSLLWYFGFDWMIWGRVQGSTALLWIRCCQNVGASLWLSQSYSETGQTGTRLNLWLVKTQSNYVEEGMIGVLWVFSRDFVFVWSSLVFTNFLSEWLYDAVVLWDCFMSNRSTG